MRQVMQALAVVTILLASTFWYYLNAAQDTFSWEEIENTPHSIVVTIDQEPPDLTEFTAKIRDITQRYRLTAIKTDVIYDREKSTIVKAILPGEKSSAIHQLPLVSGRPLDPDPGENFLSTRSTDNPHQVGQLFDLFADDIVEIRGLESWLKTRKTAEGNYWFITTKPITDRDSLQSEIFTSLGGVDPKTKNPLGAQGTRGESIAVALAPPFLAISLVLIAYISVFYFFTQIRRIGVMKLNGWTATDIWRNLFGPIIKISVSAAAFIDISLSVWYLGSLTRSFILGLIAAQVTGVLLILAVGTVMAILIQRYRVSGMLKNQQSFRLLRFFGYFFKMAFCLALMGMVANISQNFTSTLARQNDLATWNSVAEYRTITSFAIGHDGQSLEGNSTKLDDDLTTFFWDAHEKLGALYIQSNEVDSSFFSAQDSPGGAGWFDPSRVPDSFRRDRLLVSPSYLTQQQILDENGQPFDPSAEATHNLILLPSSQREDAEAVRALVEAEDLQRQVRRLQRQGRNISSLDGLTPTPVKTGFYRPQGKLFTFSWKDGLAGNFYLEDPILQVITKQTEIGEFSIGRLDTPIKIPPKEPAEFDTTIEELLARHHLTDNQLRFVRIADYLAEENQSIAGTLSVLTFIGVLLAIMCIITSRFLITALVESKKKQLFVLKYLGHRVVDRYRSLIVFHLVGYAVGYLGLTLMAVGGAELQDIILRRTIDTTSWLLLAYGLYTLAVVADALISLRYIYRAEQANTATILKGQS